MLTLHHLENSCSQRVVWLMEELGLDYEIEYYKRDPKTSLAPESLKRIIHSARRRYSPMAIEYWLNPARFSNT